MACFKQIWAALFLLLFACTTTPDEPPAVSLEDALQRPGATTVSLIPTSSGHFVIEARLPGEPPRAFLLDTGATRSAIYASTQAEIRLPLYQGVQTEVFGMMESREMPLAAASHIEIGSQKILLGEMAVLPDPPEHLDSDLDIAGIIGLDVLSGMTLILDGPAGRLSLIPSDVILDMPAGEWRAVPLIANPYAEQDLGLRFMMAGIGISKVPALLDTGSQFNVINWNVKGLWMLSHRRKQLQDAWRLSGAMGEFRPRSNAIVERIEAGNMNWFRQEFVVMDVPGLSVLQIKDRAFMIAGSSFFRSHTIVIDVTRNQMWVREQAAD